MTKQNHIQNILRFLADKEGKPIRIRKLARRLGVSEEDYGDFRAAFKKLRDQGRIVLGARNAMTLAVPLPTVTGRFHANSKGFGFVKPEDPQYKADLFIPPDSTLGAMTGDLVVARLLKKGTRNGEMRYTGTVIEVKERGVTRCAGTLECSDDTWFIVPDGDRIETPIVIRDVSAEQRHPGHKVWVEIVHYPKNRDLPEGIILEYLGQSGKPEVEIQAVMLSYGLQQDFTKEALAGAQGAALAFDPEDASHREDLTKMTVVTIDPETARDYDDAISLERLQNGNIRLGVHIADVAHFVKEGSPLDLEAYARGTSVYFPRHVVPMLPGVLSNGVCSLQEGVKRFAKTAFIDYDDSGNIKGTRLTESVIKSTKRLTYEQAQTIIDGDNLGMKQSVVNLVRTMERLARRIEVRRTQAGMLHLSLSEVELTLDDDGRVVDAVPADQSYTHKIIEMFMVEANDAVAAHFRKKEIPIVRRIHPRPEEDAFSDLARFVKACGYDLPENPTPDEIQRLIKQVEDQPASYAVNLALLRSFQRAVYSVELEPHFALASPDYCHFTSPIRRYPDLIVHRMLAAELEGDKRPSRGDGEPDLAEKAKFLSSRERVAQAAELELRLVLILKHLESKRGEVFSGIVTGVTDFGIFVQSPKFLVEGLLRLQDLGDDWWNVTADQGTVRGEMSGRVYRIGDRMEVRIDRVDVPKRHLDLSLAGRGSFAPAGRNGKPSSPPSRSVPASGNRRRRAGKPNGKR